ncbi:hypothetical protein COJ92_16035 [Priestia megaterium]|uniref:hypothetical protein n=1 Tax=Priestia megaterium TaxID=1404 RepID=UPI000BFA275D|nr:hypothetical protein [Priestia megaterium]PFP17753.1 hypothetical protein COJ92_16035 [Priestia megaterium]
MKGSPKLFLYLSILYLIFYELIFLMSWDQSAPKIFISITRILNALAAGYIPSYIVYYLVTEIPRKKELTIAEKQIRNLKNYIVQDLSIILAEMTMVHTKPKVESFNPITLNYSKCDETLKVKETTKKFINDSSKLIYPQKETYTAEIVTIPTPEGSSVEIIKMPWLSFTKKMVESTRNHIDSILTYQNYLTIEELSELQNVRNSSFSSYVLNFEKSFQNMQASHRKSWEKDFPDFFWEYYNLIRVMNGENKLKD